MSPPKFAALGHSSFGLRCKFGTAHLTLICCLFSLGTVFCWKNSLSTGGKHCKVWAAQEWGVFCMIVLSNSLHQVPLSESAPVPRIFMNLGKKVRTQRLHGNLNWNGLEFESLPVTCIDRARVKTKARFNSSDSAETRVFGSDKNLDSWGWTSAEPNPVINLRAVLSTLNRKEAFNFKFSKKTLEIYLKLKMFSNELISSILFTKDATEFD